MSCNARVGPSEFSSWGSSRTSHTSPERSRNISPNRQSIQNQGIRFPLDRRIYVQTYHTMLNMLQKQEDYVSPFFFDLIIMDEAHRSLLTPSRKSSTTSMDSNWDSRPRLRTKSTLRPTNSSIVEKTNPRMNTATPRS